MSNIIVLADHARASMGSRAAKVARASSVTSGRPRATAKPTTPIQWGAGMPLGRDFQPLTVESSCDRAAATAVVPPQASMISGHVRFMGSNIVRTVRTSQEFATRETTFPRSHDPIDGMIDQSKVIGNRLRLLREALGFSTQVSFAAELGIEKQTYNPFEKGSRELTFETACLIRQKFKVPIDWLFWGDDEEIPYHIKVKLEARRQAAA